MSVHFTFVNCEVGYIKIKFKVFVPFLWVTRTRVPRTCVYTLHVPGYPVVQVHPTCILFLFYPLLTKIGHWNIIMGDCHQHPPVPIYLVV
jgi:hypothetical protein